MTSRKIGFLDRQWFLILGDRRVTPIHAFGAAVQSENRFGDYRPANGVRFPLSIQEVEISTGKEPNSVIMQSITVNDKFVASNFGPPQFDQTPLQQMLEQFYMERTDAVSVTWTYRTFRLNNPGVDTRDGVEFTGYQMAKMGDFQGAIELLKTNAADYSTFASAQYELGRAYKAARDVTNARVFSRRARDRSEFQKGHRRT